MHKPSNKAVVPQTQHEQKGLVTDVIVPVAQSAVSGAVGAAVGAKISQAKTPPSDKS